MCQVLLDVILRQETKEPSVFWTELLKNEKKGNLWTGEQKSLNDHMVWSGSFGPIKKARISGTSKRSADSKKEKSKWPGLSPERAALSEHKTKSISQFMYIS